MLYQPHESDESTIHPHEGSTPDGPRARWSHREYNPETDKGIAFSLLAVGRSGKPGNVPGVWFTYVRFLLRILFLWPIC